MIKIILVADFLKEAGLIPSCKNTPSDMDSLAKHSGLHDQFTPSLYQLN